jgi:hypothetical protein
MVRKNAYIICKKLKAKIKVSLGSKRTVPVQDPATTPVEFDSTPTPFGTTSTQAG